jgi:cytochrome oxidase assembly protein ShyY1
MEWRRVTATGTYLPDKSVVIRYQTRDGQSGVDVVTPLQTEHGPALLVDRGWVQTDNVGTEHLRTPAPPSGRVTVQGWLRVDATGDAATVTHASARAVSSAEIAKTLDVPVYRGVVDAEVEQPRAARPLVPVPRPDLGNGPHFFYGLQWWIFGLLAVFGFFFFAYDERKKGRPEGPPGERSGSDGPEHAPVDRDHRAAHEARSG